MQNSPIPASTMPPQVNAAPVTLDAAHDSGPDSEDFSAVLARELTAKKSEPKPETALSSVAISDGQPQPPGSEIIPLQIPSESSVAAPLLLALTPGVQPAQSASEDQLTIPLKTAGPYIVGVSASDQATGGQPRIAVKNPRQHMMVVVPSDQPLVPVNTPRQHMTGVVPDDQASGDRPLIPGNTPMQHLMGALPGNQASGSEPPIPAKALPAASSAETSAQRNFPQAALATRPASESDNTADFAAPGKFLPPVAAEEKMKTSRSGTEAQVPQRLPEAAPLLQMTHLAAAAAPASASAPTPQNLNLEIRVGAPGWNGELAQKVVWMATQQQQVAELHLNPPHLGPVEVTLTVGNDQGAQASIQFASPHLATREAIESALPRLREMMADSGIALGNVTVSADSFQQQAEAGRQDRLLMKQPGDIGKTATGLAGRSAVTFIRGEHNGLVDTFA